MNLQDVGNLLLGAFALLCLLPLLLALIAGFFLVRFGYRQVDRLLNPNVTRLTDQLTQLRVAQPNASTDQLVSQIVRQEAIKCGLIGAVTGLGGFITLPIALPVDMLLSLRIQAALVDFIALAYGHTQTSNIEAQVRSRLIMSGSGELAEAATSVALKFITRLVGKSFSKFVPVIGAAVSFGVNYLIVQAIGRSARGWYSAAAR